MRLRHHKRYVSANDRWQARTNLDDFKLEALKSACASNDAITQIFMNHLRHGHLPINNLTLGVIRRMSQHNGDMAKAMKRLLVIDGPRISFSQPFKPIRISTMEPELVFQRTGWRKEDLLAIVYLWSESEYVSHKRHRFPRDLAILMALERIRSGADFTTFVATYGGESRRWSEAFDWFVCIGYEYAKALMQEDALMRYVEQGEECNTAINNVLTESGFVPGEGENNCVGLLDATMIDIANPGNPVVQNSFYSGYSGKTCLKALTLIFPNGMTGFIAFSSGRRPDHAIARDFEINAKIRKFVRAVLNGRPGSYYFYGDKIFPISGFIRSPNDVDNRRRFSREFVAEHPQWIQRMRQQDEAFKQVRAAVEHSYASIKNEMRYTENRMKHCLSRSQMQVSKLVPLLFFIADLKTICVGNQRNAKFLMKPPTMAAYIAGLENINSF